MNSVRLGRKGGPSGTILQTFEWVVALWLLKERQFEFRWWEV